MKTILHYALILTLLISIPAFGQWNSDPDMPVVVCTAAGIQSNVVSFADGNGGIYTFWRDARTGNNHWDVYGQHYNADGEAQWEENGKELVNYEGRINYYSIVSLGGGEFMMAWSVQYSTSTSENGIYVQKFSATGSPIWPTAVKVRNDSNYTNGIAKSILIESGGAFYIVTQATVIGGSNNAKICKIDGDGNLLWPFGGTTPPSMTGFGGMSASSDQNGGLYIYHNNGNGSGAGMKCMLIGGTNDLVNQWANWASVLTGTQGLSYQYSGIGDPTGITFVWQGTGSEGTSGNLYARRVLATNGSFGWNETTKLICVADGSQSNFYWKKSGNNYFITWADGRPGVVGNYAIYAQKFTNNGVILWEENGVEIADLNTYIPNPEFDLDENNTMCITHKAGPGFMSQKITTDGEIVWEPVGVIALSNGYAPFYEDYNLVYTGGKFLVVSAKSVASGGADNIYIGNITLPAVQVIEDVTACNEYTAYGSTFTESDTYIIDLQDTVITLNLTIVQNIAEISIEGNTLISVYDGVFQWIDCSTETYIEDANGPILVVTETGSYALEITNGECVVTSDCVEVIITSTDEKADDYFQIFPNPGTGLCNISFSGLQHPQALRIVDITGRVVYASRLTSVETLHTVDFSEAAVGTYFIRIEFENGLFSTGKWIKH